MARNQFARPIEPARLLRLYEQGHFTPMELRMRLIQAAADYPPEGFASLLPAEELQAIRELAASPPNCLEESPRIFAIATVVGPWDQEAEECHERQLWYDGVWSWHRYFQTNP